MGLKTGVQILMADGTLSGIESVLMGDRIMGDNGQWLNVTNIIKGYEMVVLQIELENNSLPPIHMTPDNVVMTSVGEKQAKQLVCGDALKCENGSFSTIIRTEMVCCNDHVYDLCLGRRDTYFAGGIAVGSWEVEEEYALSRDA